MPPLSAQPPARLAPAARASPPPPAPGDVRVDWFGVDVPAPAGAELLAMFEVQEIDWDGCHVQLVDGSRDPTAVVAGTLRLSCFADGADCGDVCRRIRPVAGGPATEPYPTDPPLIELARYAGDDDSGRENLLVWRDGTVQLDGERCKRWRGRRAMLPAARVAELAGVLEQGGFLEEKEAPPRAASGEDTHEGGWLALGDHVVRWSGPLSAADELAPAIDRVRQAVGANPCTP